MAQQITDAEIEERTHLLELVKISTEVFSRQQYERLKELSNKMFDSAGSPHIAKENTKHMAQVTDHIGDTDKMVTAVEWFMSQIPFEWSSSRAAFEAFEQAKQMEKEQIMKAVDIGFDEGCKFPEDISLKNAEQYYNQTYKTQAQ